jgi:hypothetical protein
MHMPQKKKKEEEKESKVFVKDRIRTCASEDTAYTAFDSRAAR